MTLLGLRLGRDIGEKIREERLFTKADYLIPVPLHKAKLRERGYNQSELLCKGIAEVTKIPMSSTFLKRKRHTQTQTRLSWEERKQNVSNAFMIETKHEKVLAGTTVIVVDDVITTGSTINECAKILRECGVREVFAASAALA
jgi:ComF family protein